MKKIISVFIIFSILSFFTSAFASGFSSYDNGKDITAELILEKSAVYIEEDNSIFLCPKNSYALGNAVFPFEIDKNFSLSFDYKIGGGSSADGIAFNFFANKVSTSTGGYIGIDGAEGYAVELDTFRNGWDMDNSHVALVSGKSDNHLAAEHVSNLRDNTWHSARIDVENNLICVYIDGRCVLTNNQYFNTTGRIAYFAAATGSSVDNHYIRNVRYSTEKEFNNDITINRSGRAYARFVIKDKNSNVLRNKKLKYMLSGFANYTQISEVTTDQNGVALIKTPVLSGCNEKKVLNVTFPDVETERDIYSFTVTINDLSYTHSWEGKVSAGVGVEGNLGYDGKIAVLEAKASLASLSAEGKGSKTLSLTEEYENGVRNLRISSSQNLDAAGEANFGVFAESNIGKFKAEVAPASISGDVAFGSGGEVALNIENYSPENKEHISKIAYFLLDSSMPEFGSNVLLKLLARAIYGFSFNETNNSLSLKLGAGAHFGLANFGDVLEAEIAGVNVDSFYTYSFGTDKDLNRVYNSSAELATGASLMTFKAGEEDVDSTVSAYGGDAVINNIELNATVSDGETEELSLIMHEKSYSNSVIWYEESKNIYKEFTFSDAAARAAAAEDIKVDWFTRGLYGLFAVYEMKQAAKALLGSGYDATYSKRHSLTQGIDADFEIGVSALVGGSIGFGLSAIESCDYENQNGVLQGGESYMLCESYPEDYVNQSRKSIQEVLAEPINYLKGEIEKSVVTEVQTPEKGVKNEKAKITGRTRRKVGLTGVCPVPKVQSFSILTMSEENVSSAKTVGDPYVVTLYNESGSYVDEIEDEGILLTLSYDSEDLAAAGIENTEDALLPLKIYRWDDARGAYTMVGGELNFEESSVAVNITKSGQYILAVDTSSPEISELKVIGSGAQPVISAFIRDMSGIEAAELKIDGITVADKNNFESFYNPSRAILSYTPSEPLSSGEHTAELTAQDTAGNRTPEPVILKFTVNTTAPVITAVSLPELVTDGKLVITAQTEGTPTSVIADICYMGASHSYTMTSKQGIWTAEIDDLPSNTVISASVFAYDAYGNVTQSDSYEIINFGNTKDIADLGIFDVSDNKLYAAITNSGEKISGKILAAGYDDTYGLKDVSCKDFTFDTGYTAFDIEIDSDCKEYKLFFWDKDLKPISSPSYKLNK